MASDVIAGPEVLTCGDRMNINNTSSVPEARTYDDGDGDDRRQAPSSPSSSGVSGEVDEEDLDELKPTVENRSSTPDNGRSAPGARNSTPSAAPNGR